MNGWSTHTKGLALALLTAGISGVAVYVNGLGVSRFDDATVYTTAKNLVAALILLAVLAPGRAGGGAWRRPRSGRDRRMLAAIAVIGGSVPFVLFFEGLSRAASADAAFIHKTLIVWVALLAVPLLGERLNLWHVGAIGLLIAGQAVLTEDLTAFSLGSGEWMILGATLLWALEFVVAKRVLADAGSLTVGAARMAGGVVLLLGYLAATGRLGALTGLSAGAWAWAALVGAILAGFVASWYAALARIQAVDAAAVLVFAAVITAGLSGLLDGASLAPAALGLVLVTAGTAAAAVAVLRRREREAVPT
jgi:drug/metabolite transporter (DMT)-like permease